jgi:heme/copper-type cytochrome/quinol oxidase subunit 1
MLSLVSSIGAGIIGLAIIAFIYNVYISARQKKPAGADPWGGYTMEWLTASPPPRFNYNAQFPVPRIRSHTPALDLRERQRERSAGGEARSVPGGQ